MIRNITVLLFICLFTTSVHAAQVSVDPSYMDVVKGENFTVDILIDPEGSEVYGAQYELHFNNTLLNATLQTKGTFLSQDGANTNVMKNEINNTIGLVKYGEMRNGFSYGVFNPGILATITFQAIAEENGISELRLENTKLSDPFVNPITTSVTSGNVSVKIGIRGDVTGDNNVNMGDVTKLLWNQTYWGQYPVNPWAADVTGDNNVNMGDVTKLLWNQTYWGEYPLTC